MKYCSRSVAVERAVTKLEIIFQKRCTTETCILQLTGGQSIEECHSREGRCDAELR